MPSSIKIFPIRELLGPEPSLESQQQRNYVREGLVRVFSRVFTSAEVLGRAANISYSEMLTFAGTYLDFAIAEGFSYVAVETASMNVVGFLFVEDLGGPSKQTIKSGLVDKVEKATSDRLGAVFQTLESLHNTFKDKIGVKKIKRGQYFHILAAGAVPEVQGTGIAFAMVVRVYQDLVGRTINPFAGMLAEATGFSSQKILKNTLIPELSWMVDVKLSDFKRDDGSPLFPTAQTPTIQLSYQFAASEGSLERTFQEALLFVGSHKYLMDTMIDLQLRLFALHKRTINGNVRKPQRMMDVVGHAKYRAAKKVAKENLTRDGARQQFVNLVQQFFPEWRVMLKNIIEIPISQTTLRKLEQQLMAQRGVTGGDGENCIDVKAIWVKDKYAGVCMRCEKVKFGLLKRRHHCRSCGLVVCESCSPHRVALPKYLKIAGLHRACHNCAEAIWRQADKEAEGGYGGNQRRLNSRTKMRISGEKIRAPTIL